MSTDIIQIQKKYGKQIAHTALEHGAIKLSPEEPFTWASGYKMPIYNDNRRLLAFPEMRRVICEAFAAMAKALNTQPEWIAGVATGGIPHGAILADTLELPFAYIRSASKDHGLQNQIEGLGNGASFGGKKVLVIEDLISTGGSSIKAVEAVRVAEGTVPYCFAIFSYGFDKANNAFAQMKPSCVLLTILDYTIMLETALENKLISETQKRMLEDWRRDPFNWWEKQSR